jgi:hypothetical protein
MADEKEALMSEILEDINNVTEDEKTKNALLGITPGTVKDFQVIEAQQITIRIKTDNGTSDLIYTDTTVFGELLATMIGKITENLDARNLAIEVKEAELKELL